jgi:glycosyltransferase involved in cell wall biosynthesis
LEFRLRPASNSLKAELQPVPLCFVERKPTILRVRPLFVAKQKLRTAGSQAERLGTRETKSEICNLQFPICICFSKSGRRPLISIRFLIPTLDRSGAEKQLTLLACNLPRDRFEVEVIALTRGGPYEDELRRAGVRVTVLGKRRKLDLGALRSLRRWLREQPPDILHSWLFASNAYARLALPRHRRFKVVVSERCVDSWKAGWQLWLDRRLISRTDRLLANSRSVADFYREQGVPQDLLAVIPNAVVQPPKPTVSRMQLLSDLSLPADVRLVGYVGRLAKQKKIETILWGIQVLRQADEDARLLIIGDGPEKAALQQYARDVECADFVRFLGHREDASSLLHHLDVFWLASGFEGMSNSLMEAMTCGVPVIASDIPPNRELITHGEHGFLVNLDDGVGYAQYTAKLFREPELRHQLVDAARRRMETEFSVDRMVAAHVAIYDSLTGLCPRP